MKKQIAAALAACVLLTGCSGGSQQISSSIAEDLNGISDISSTDESSSSLISTSNEPQEINDKELEEFNQKCKDIVEQFSIVLSDSYSVQITEPNVKYDNDDVSLSKIYVLKTDLNGEEDRILYGFLDIYCEDEYTYFQSAKNFINFIDENAIEISGQYQYAISINSTTNGISDISIFRGKSGGSSNYTSTIIYGDRGIYAAYSDRLKNMEMLKDSNESISILGLINYDDLPKDVVSYDITVQYEGKSLTHKWYKLENVDDDISFVTYIDDGTYNDISDEELVYYAYNSILDPQNELESSSYSYDFYFAYKSGKEPACSIYYNLWFQDYSLVSWSGQYEHLNSNPLNQELLRELTGETSE